VFSVGCLILGHDDMMVRSSRRMWLRCQHCGRDTAGWIIGPEMTPVHRLLSRDQRRASSLLTGAGRPRIVPLSPRR
jgi:hypothetical protein